TLQAIVVNSANANSCTGDRGIQDAKDTQSWVAERLNIEPHHVGIASTGVIGSFLPMDKMKHGVDHVLNDAFNQSEDRKSTRLNSSHVSSSYAVFCLKKKSIETRTDK